MTHVLGDTDMESAPDNRLPPNEGISYDFKNRNLIRNISASALVVFLSSLFSSEVREHFLNNLILMISFIYLIYLFSSALFCSIYVLIIVSFREYTEVYFYNGARNEFNLLIKLQQNKFYNNLVILLFCYFLIYRTFWGFELNTRVLKEIKKTDL